jgi:hypothetical protein
MKRFFHTARALPFPPSQFLFATRIPFGKRAGTLAASLAAFVALAGCSADAGVTSGDPAAVDVATARVEAVSTRAATIEAVRTPLYLDGDRKLAVAFVEFSANVRARELSPAIVDASAATDQGDALRATRITRLSPSTLAVVFVPARGETWASGDVRAVSFRFVDGALTGERGEAVRTTTLSPEIQSVGYVTPSRIDLALTVLERAYVARDREDVRRAIVAAAVPGFAELSRTATTRVATEVFAELPATQNQADLRSFSETLRRSIFAAALEEARRSSTMRPQLEAFELPLYGELSRTGRSEAAQATLDLRDQLRGNVETWRAALLADEAATFARINDAIYFRDGEREVLRVLEAKLDRAACTPREALEVAAQLYRGSLFRSVLTYQNTLNRAISTTCLSTGR